MSHHNNIHVNCTMEQPLQLLIDKLSSKSSDLYIFWQNYNMMYQQCHEKTQEISRLRQQITVLKDKAPNFVPDVYVREQHWNSEGQIADLQKEIERLKKQNIQYKKQNSNYHQENLHLQTVLHQLREQNSLQRNNIEKIMRELKNTQAQIEQYDKIYDQIAQKDATIDRYIERERELNDCITQRDAEIDNLVRNNREMRNKYEDLIKDAMQNAKNKVIETLPDLIKVSRRTVDVN